jgi:NhaC family Na+:H+ antiporter
MFKKAFEDRGLKPENLSRALEDSGTVTSALVPWNTCGAYQSSVLGVATGDYFMYAIFNWMSPLVSMLLAATGWTITRTSSGASTKPSTPQ